MKIGRGVRQGCCLSLTVYSFIKEAVEGFGDFTLEQ